MIQSNPLSNRFIIDGCLLVIRHKCECLIEYAPGGLCHHHLLLSDEVVKSMQKIEGHLTEALSILSSCLDEKTFPKQEPKTRFIESLRSVINQSWRDNPKCFEKEFQVFASVCFLEGLEIPKEVNLLFDEPHNDSYRRFEVDLYFESTGYVRHDDEQHLVAFYTVKKGASE